MHKQATHPCLTCIGITRAVPSSITGLLSPGRCVCFPVFFLSVFSFFSSQAAVTTTMSLSQWQPQRDGHNHDRDHRMAQAATASVPARTHSRALTSAPSSLHTRSYNPHTRYSDGKKCMFSCVRDQGFLGFLAAITHCPISQASLHGDTAWPGRGDDAANSPPAALSAARDMSSVATTVTVTVAITMQWP
ncbi:hypothetical protein F5148DRAFT_612052 [Russula earlei]|uniref:Uncharacterized protein n=1 Tax=Russula earlei TaxID=71964 RepID=A0ACC0TUT8_9AGAM|nr:hypothetical protein F5148DRAFT_612052 [Russula earlei]